MWKQHHRIKKKTKRKKTEMEQIKKQKQIKRDNDIFGSDLQIPMNTHG